MANDSSRGWILYLIGLEIRLGVIYMIHFEVQAETALGAKILN